MKRLSFILSILIVFFLTGCALNQTDYRDFEDHYVFSYSEAETKSSNRYILYYFDSTKDESDTIKSEVLSFFKEFNLFEFYLLDTAQIGEEQSQFGAYIDEPIIYIVSSQNAYKTYQGITEIRDFIVEYSTLELDYDVFEDQHLSSVSDALLIEHDNYIVYYYLENCPHCIAAKEEFLAWAITKNIEDIYFINGAEVEAPENFPTDLIILQSGTPMLILMSNGVFMDEYYSGTEAVLDYIEAVGSAPIITMDFELDYEDFIENTLSSYTETVSITNELHFEYYYSPTCPHCNAIKTTILNFLKNQDEVDFYIINASSATGVPKIEGFRGVPALYLIQNNEVVAQYIGSLDIPAFIEDYYKGNIDFSVYE